MSEAPTEQEECRLLLADGVVGRTGDGHGLEQWGDALAQLARADGLRGGLIGVAADDVSFGACIVLLNQDGTHMHSPIDYPSCCR